MIRMGVVADDITGSNDIGIMFAKAGYRTRVYNFEQPGDFTAQYKPCDEPEICILNTNSRLDDAQTAYRKAYDATRELKEAGCTQYHNKTCSVFRGNIGTEFDAMLDALGHDFGVVVLGFPKNGRTTVDGIHYVRGVPLEQSEFRNDPVHPMTQSNLVDILQSQTQRRVGLLTHEVISAGSASIREHLVELKGNYGYVIFDVADQQSLATIAQAVADETALFGSSALAEELPPVWQDGLDGPQPLNLARANGVGILCAAGSLMPQTSAQIEHMRENDAVTVELDTIALFERNRETLIHSLVDNITQNLKTGKDVVFHTVYDATQVKSTRTRGQQQGLSQTETSRLVSSTVAEVVVQVLALTGQNRLLIAGGETSDAVCKRMGINSLQIHEEIQPGLPSCITLTDPALLLVLKSGSFGSADFFQQALDHLRSA